MRQMLVALCPNAASGRPTPHVEHSFPARGLAPNGIAPGGAYVGTREVHVTAWCPGWPS